MAGVEAEAPARPPLEWHGGALRPRPAEPRPSSVGPRHERIQRELSALAVRGELESIRQQDLQHRLHLGRRRVSGRLGLDVESIGADPVRPTGNLSILSKSVRRADQLTQRRADAREPAVWQQTDSPQRERATRFVRLDGGDFESCVHRRLGVQPRWQHSGDDEIASIACSARASALVGLVNIRVHIDSRP